MRILHYYPADGQDIIAPYVDALSDSMGVDAVNDKATQGAEAMQALRTRHYDILHLHGCWRNTSCRVVGLALKRKVRLVVSPHGQLEPWVIGEKYWGEKLPKQLLYQKHIVSRAYAVVIQGKMEEECMQKLGWNPRTVIIRNCLITHSITRQEMARQMFQVYRRIMDSNTIELMTDDTKTTLRQLLKTGITGDRRWLREPLLTIPDYDQWRMLLCHANQEQVWPVVERGLRILQMEVPDVDVEHVSCFMPEGYRPAESIEHSIGMQFATENERLLATFRHLRKLQFHSRLTLAHLVELDRELRQHSAEEDRLGEALKERHLYKFAGRLMQLMADLTGLDEGYMPLPPVDDRRTRQTRKMIDNHLKI